MEKSKDQIGIFRLFVVSKCFDSIAAKEHRLVIKNYRKPEIQDLKDALKDVYPFMDYGTYSLYCRLGKNDLFPVVDYSSMVLAFKVMGSDSGANLYLIKNDIKKWLDERPQLRCHPDQIKLTVEYDTKKDFPEVSKVSRGCQHEQEVPHTIFPRIKLQKTKRKI